MVSGEPQRWHGQRSSFTWEQDALDFVKARLPQTEPYRAWQTFTFTGPHGHVREVDLLLAAPGGLFLVEIKSHPGSAANNGSTWLFRDGSTVRTIENPLHFTDQKAKELRTQLQRAADKRPGRLVIPRVEAAVFLSAENLRCDPGDFDEFQRQRVYSRDGLKNQTDLDGIWDSFLNQPPASEHRRVTPALSQQLPDLMRAIGIARLNKGAKVGPYELQARSFDAGPSWEDYLAANPALPNDEPRRVRVYLSEQTATEEERKSTQRAARREYLAIQGISHEGIVRAEQYSDELFTGPAVVFRHGERWQRLDHFMAAEGRGLAIETRLEMIRQVAEALDHAHRRHLYHRALAPRSVYVEMDGRYPRLRIADWQVAARPHSTSTPGRPKTTLTALLQHVERSAGPYLAPEFTTPAAPSDLLDVFGLGALSYLILTGYAPAEDREQLARKLTEETEHALVPSSVADSIGPDLDMLVRKATARHHAERTRSIRNFLRTLDRIEQDLAEPEGATDVDPLTAGIGDFIEGWEVKRVLGKGSTSRALLVTRDGAKRVFKVAQDEAAGRRLRREADELSRLNDSHVARLLEAPFPSGPPGRERVLIGVEYVGDHTLAEELRRAGPAAMTLQELNHLGEDLLQAVIFLDKRRVWHRDIKPENLALRRLPGRGRELVLFDFSLAGVPDTDLGVGTRDYIDPFLGPPRRNRFDQAAELYAVAVTLHEMVSGELPSWADGITPAGFLDADEQIQLAEDIFDPVVRDGLVAFFRKAFDRSADRRFGSPHEMRRAWSHVFDDVATDPPATTSSTEDPEDDTDERTREAVQAKRDAAADRAVASTPLVAAGLSPYALSTARRYLEADTAGALARIPARRITVLKGVGRDTKDELVARAMEWRQRFGVSEVGLSHPDIQDHDPERITPPPQDLSSSDAEPELDAAGDLADLPVDEVAQRLVPASPPALRQVTGQVSPGAGKPVSVWADRVTVANALRLSVGEVAVHLARLRNRWAKSVPELKSVRGDVTDIVRGHGRVLDVTQLTAALLAMRGAGLDAPVERLRVAAICVRAAIETEERLDRPRLLTRRLGTGLIIALTGEDEDGETPRAEDLFAYAELLGEEADQLASRDPLASAAEVRQALREVDTADHAARLSDTDLVRLAAASSRNAAVTTRLDLYPRDMDKLRALRLSQAGSLVGNANSDGFARRVRARFPALDMPPEAEDIPGLLARLGWDTKADSRHGNVLNLLSSTGQGQVGQASNPVTSISSSETNRVRAGERLAEASRQGGFVAVKTRVESAAALCGYLSAMDDVAAVNVGAMFVRLLREVVAEQGRPRWDVVLAADSSSASPAARTGFAALLAKAWERLAAQIRAIGDNRSIVLLHDATPLARYSGGLDVLAKLAVSARDAGESPFGLWLLCPMPDPRGLPRLDGETVGIIPGDAEHVYVPDDFVSRKDQKAS